MKFDTQSYTPPDVLFSYWIFVFVIVYFLGFKKYNPLFLLILGLVHNFFLFILYLFIAPIKYVFLFCFVNFLIKIIPIYLLRNTTIKKKDIYFSISLFLIYLFYIYILYFVFGKKNAYNGIYSKTIHVGFFSYMLNKLFYK